MKGEKTLIKLQMTNRERRITRSQWVRAYRERRLNDSPSSYWGTRRQLIHLRATQCLTNDLRLSPAGFNQTIIGTGRGASNITVYGPIGKLP